MTERILSNWLDSYLELFSNSEVPLLYNKWMGISVIASCLERRCYQEWDKNIYPNMYILLIGPSSARKGTAMEIPLLLLRKAEVNIASNSTTREALIRTLRKSVATFINTNTDMPVLHCSLTIFSKELSVLLEGEQGKRMLPVLCEWFDCEDSWSYDTIVRGEEEIDGVWVNLVGATTPNNLQNTLPKNIIGGGFLSRCILLYAAGREKRVAYPVLSKEQKELIAALSSDLQVIKEINGKFKMTEGYLEVYTTWYDKTDDIPIHLQEDVFEHYCGRRATHLRKLTMILSAAKSNDMILTEEDIHLGLEVLEEAEKEMPKVFKGYGQAKFAEMLPRIMKTIGALSYRKEKITFDMLYALYIKDLLVDDLRTILVSLEKIGFCNTRAENINGKMIDVITLTAGREEGKDE